MLEYLSFEKEEKKKTESSFTWSVNNNVIYTFASTPFHDENSEYTIYDPQMQTSYRYIVDEHEPYYYDLTGDSMFITRVRIR